jgi:hypothetical protein
MREKEKDGKASQRLDVVVAGAATAASLNLGLDLHGISR